MFKMITMVRFFKYLAIEVEADHGISDYHDYILLKLKQAIGPSFQKTISMYLQVKQPKILVFVPIFSMHNGC